jgi:hypothetical protein
VLKKYRLLLLILIVLLFPAAARSADITDGWEFHKEIKVNGSNRYKAFFLDEGVYKHVSTDLSDLRITDQNGQFVPYYIHSGTTALKATETYYNTALTDSFNKEGDTYLDFKITPLQQNADILGNKLIFSLPVLNFFKNLEIYGSHDGVVWEYVLSDNVYRVDKLDKDQMALPGTKKYGYYRVKILDNVENIKLGLQLVHSFREKEYESYQRGTTLSHEVKQEKNHTFITLNNSNRLRVKNIRLSVSENFQRLFEVFGDDGPNFYRGELYNLQFRDYTISKTDISFTHTPLLTERIIIKISNLDNRPLHINSIQVEYLLDKIVFEDKGGENYRLWFGNPEAVKPRYEIELFKDHVEREQQDFSTLGGLVRREEPEPEPPAFRLDILFNIVIGAVSLLLVVFLARKLSVRE